MNEALRRLSVAAWVFTPLGAWAQTAGALPGGLNKPVQVLTQVQGILIAASVVLLTISFVGMGIAMAFYKKRWEDLQAPVLGGVIIGIARALAAWLIN